MRRALPYIDEHGWLKFPPALLRRCARKGLSVLVALHRQTPRDIIFIYDAVGRLPKPLIGRK